MPITSKQTAADLMDRLPSHLPATPHRERTRVTAFGGLTPDKPSSWGISHMMNLYPHKYPALATRRPRELLAAASGGATGHGLAVVDKDLYLVRGTVLYRILDALQSSRSAAYVSTMGTVSDTDKCMVAFGDYLLIFPDKLYLRLSDGTLHPMELDTEVAETATFRDHHLILSGGASWSSRGFLPGDSIHVINMDDVNPAPEGYYVIKELHGHDAVMKERFPAEYSGSIRIKREVPNLSMAAVSGNRLFGSDGVNLYIGGEGSPFAFQGKLSDGRGAATLSSNSAGNITACASWQGYMLFFKTASICRVLGNRADSFTLLETPAPGIPAAMAPTLCEVGGELYYSGDTGIYRYANISQKPERIGQFSAQLPSIGRGGSDGVAYTVELAFEDTDGAMTWRRYLYMPKEGSWYAESGAAVSAHACLGGFLCTQGVDGRVWISRCDGRMMGYASNEKTVFGTLRSSVTFHPDYTHEPDGYRPICLYLRVTHEAASEGELRVVASFADGASGRDARNPVSSLYSLESPSENAAEGRVELATFTGKMQDRLLRIPLGRPRCDHMILALEMSGEWEVDAIIFEYEIIQR